MFDCIDIASFSSADSALLIVLVILFSMLTLWSIIVIIKYEKEAIPNFFEYKFKLGLKTKETNRRINEIFSQKV